MTICQYAPGGDCSNPECQKNGCLMNVEVEVLVWSEDQPVYQGTVIEPTDARNVADGKRFFWEDNRLVWRGPAHECRDEPNLYSTPEYMGFIAAHTPKVQQPRAEPVSHFGEPLFYTVQIFDPAWANFVIKGVFTKKEDADKELERLRQVRTAEGNHPQSLNVTGAVCAMTFQRLCYQLAQFYVSDLLIPHPGCSITLTGSVSGDRRVLRNGLPSQVVVERDLLDIVVKEFRELAAGLHSCRGDDKQDWKLDPDFQDEVYTLTLLEALLK